MGVVDFAPGISGTDGRFPLFAVEGELEEEEEGGVLGRGLF